MLWRQSLQDGEKLLGAYGSMDEGELMKSKF
jgi:hypothetical protein